MSHSYYETPNPYLASFLLCCGASLVSFRRASARRFVFRFAADVRLHQLLRMWWSRTAVPMEPARIFASLQKLRSLVRGRPLHATHYCAAEAAQTPVPADDHAHIGRERETVGTSPASTPPPVGSAATCDVSPPSR